MLTGVEKGCCLVSGPVQVLVSKQDGITAAKGSGGGERDEGREGWEGKLVQGSAGRNSLERELRKKALQVEALCMHYMSYKKVVHCH